jgi:hypothetical protein
MSSKAPRPVCGDRAAAGIRYVGQRLDIRSHHRAQYPSRLRRQRQVERICKIPRLVSELLDEISRHYGLEEDIADRLERYAELDPNLLAQLGAARFPASPVRLVGGDQ